ncbi:hypothetical protein [Rhizobium herbae]|uniref:DUF962 domain-containing protein n=1 Tax=Rhizobium herbae TaxID=508661 RepID=A0ABS4EP12_9HYPH|nr:hypothetical protein [Rhizobium herbae]MBP1859687.1 hypothetical protein [Rhizobium herbae]
MPVFKFHIGFSLEFRGVPMRRNSMLYFSSAAALAAFPIVGVFTTSYSEPSLALMATVGFAVLTFPLGILAWAIGFPLVYYGIATPAEMVFVMTPFYAVLGYIQWARILPAYYRRQR